MVDVKNLTNVTLPPGKNKLILQDASRIKAKTGKRMEMQTNAFGANTELSFPTQVNMNIMMKLYSLIKFISIVELIKCMNLYVIDVSIY